MTKIIVTEKYCPKCKTVKPASDFYPDSYNATGLRGRCKECCKTAPCPATAARHALAAEGMKRCSRCKVIKPLAQFNPRKGRPGGLGVVSHCKQCIAGVSAEYQHTPQARAVAAAQQAERRRYNPEKERARKQKYHASEGYKAGRDARNTRKRQWHQQPQVKRATLNNDLKRKYGITADEYDNLLKQQNGVCAICRRAPKGKRRLGVDHDHQTGIVRSLLCNPCNSILGNWKDSPETAQRALDYLLAHRQLRLVV